MDHRQIMVREEYNEEGGGIIPKKVKQVKKGKRSNKEAREELKTEKSD